MERVKKNARRAAVTCAPAGAGDTALAATEQGDLRGGGTRGGCLSVPELPAGPPAPASMAAVATSVLAGQQEHRDLPGGLGQVFADGGRLRDQQDPSRPGALADPREAVRLWTEQLGRARSDGLESMLLGDFQRGASVAGGG